MRWAMSRVVFPARLFFRLSRMIFSVRVSTAETESSRIRIGASFSRARAMEMRCFWPPESGDAALAEDGLIAVLEIHDVVPDISETGRPLDVLRRGFVHTEGDVVGDGVREEEVVLRDIGAGLPHRADGNAVDVLSIHKEGAVGHIVGAEKQVHQRVLPEPVLPTMPTLSPGATVKEMSFSTSNSPSG